MSNDMNSERKRILKMLEEGTINAEEANKLLLTLETDESRDNDNKVKQTEGRRFIKILVEEAGREKVNISIPLSLARLALKFIPNSARDSLDEQDIDIDEILEAIDEGVENGTLINIDDGDDHVVIKMV